MKRGGTVEVPQSLRYTATHEWVAEQGDGTASIGITAIATDQLGDMVYVELPKVGERLKQGETAATVESTKAASDVYAPLSGEVIEVNADLVAHPEKVNEAPYDAGWLFKLRLADPKESQALLDADAYRASAEGGGAS
jgi:glycine cleavage system H protein